MPDQVGVVLGIYAAFGRRDWDAFKAPLSDEVEWHQLTAVPDQTTFRGPGAIVESFLIAQWLDQFPDMVVELEELIDAGDSVAVIGTAIGHGRESGLDLRFRFVHSWRFLEGRVVEVHDVAGEPHRLRRGAGNESS